MEVLISCGKNVESNFLDNNTVLNGLKHLVSTYIIICSAQHLCASSWAHACLGYCYVFQRDHQYCQANPTNSKYLLISLGQGKYEGIFITLAAIKHG